MILVVTVGLLVLFTAMGILFYYCVTSPVNKHNIVQVPKRAYYVVYPLAAVGSLTLPILAFNDWVEPVEHFVVPGVDIPSMPEAARAEPESEAEPTPVPKPKASKSPPLRLRRPQATQPTTRRTKRDHGF